MEDTTSNRSEPRIDDTISSKLIHSRYFLRTTDEGERTVGIEYPHKMPDPFSFPSDHNPIAKHFTDMKNSANATSLTSLIRTGF